MKAEEARALIKFSERDYNAQNKMINSTVAWQAVQVAEDELQKKAIQAFKLIFNEHPELEQQFINYLTI